MFVAFTAYVFHVDSNPFMDKSLNMIENLSLVMATVTLYAGLYYIAGQVWLFFYLDF